MDNPITKITGAFRKAAPDLADLRKRLQVAEEALLVARATAAEKIEAHDAAALELLSRKDSGTAHAASRDAITAATDRVTDLSRVIVTLRESIAGAVAAEERESMTKAWQKAADALDVRTQAMADLQLALDVLASTFHGVLRANEEAWLALPEKPNGHPYSITPAGIEAIADMYLVGASGGKLGRSPINPHVARQRADLVTVAKDLANQLLAPSCSTEGATT